MEEASREWVVALRMAYSPYRTKAWMVSAVALQTVSMAVLKVASKVLKETSIAQTMERVAEMLPSWYCH
jgi:hypothetical protein